MPRLTRLAVVLVVFSFSGAVGAFDQTYRAAYRTSAGGWSQHTCWSGGVDGPMCWVMARGTSEFTAGLHVASLFYVCSPETGAEELRLGFFPDRRAQLDTANPVLSVRWDVLGQIHALETVDVRWYVNEHPETRQRANGVNYFIGDAEHVIDRIRFHDVLWVDLPYVDKWERAKFPLTNAIPAMREALNACGLDRSSIGWLGDRP